ncbi:hypothetical protein [Qipengyuania sp. JC766]|uniref:hypothetical protein n=1 Tax=Qipengyuania sp. JC766 TaxID=3232139 RepID=UPI0034590672
MKKHNIAVAVATIALTACSAAGAPDTGGADVPDGLISCVMDDYDGTGASVTQPFLLMDGAVKRYAQTQNVAFDLCEPGQENCSLGIVDGNIEMDWTAPSGHRSQYSVDLDALTIEAREAKPGEELRDIAFEGRCERLPLPEGLQTP